MVDPLPRTGPGAGAHDARDAEPTVARPLRLFGWDRRPEIVVLHDDGLWYEGRLRAWRHAGRQGWRATVTYHVAVGRQHYREVPASHVRRREPADDPRVYTLWGETPPAPSPPEGTGPSHSRPDTTTAGSPSHPEEDDPAVTS